MLEKNYKENYEAAVMTIFCKNFKIFYIYIFQVQLPHSCFVFSISISYDRIYKDFIYLANNNWGTESHGTKSS